MSMIVKGLALVAGVGFGYWGVHAIGAPATLLIGVAAIGVGVAIGRDR